LLSVTVPSAGRNLMKALVVKHVGCEGPGVLVDERDRYGFIDAD
jgi:hypothetical protein